MCIHVQGMNNMRLKIDIACGEYCQGLFSFNWLLENSFYSINSNDEDTQLKSSQTKNFSSSEMFQKWFDLIDTNDKILEKQSIRVWRSRILSILKIFEIKLFTPFLHMLYM